MASVAGMAANASLAGAGFPVIGWAVGLATAVVDQLWVYPALAGQPDDARQPQLVDLPTGSQLAGAPRVWAYGQRVRVGCHVLYQSSKVRESNIGGEKAGDVSIRRIFVDALIHLNDRPSDRLMQLVGNGQLLLFTDRNVYYVSTATMSGQYELYGSTPTARVQVGSRFEPDFTETFDVGDLVMPERFVTASGGNHPYNQTYFEVHAVLGHTSVPSRVWLKGVDGQTINASTAVMQNAGIFNRAQLTKVQDALAYLSTDTWQIQSTVRVRFIINGTDRCNLWLRTFQANQAVRIRNAYSVASSTNLADFTGTISHFVNTGSPINVVNMFVDVPAGTLSASNVGTMTAQAGRQMLCEIVAGSYVANAVFDAGYQPQLEYYSGEIDQGQPQVLIDNIGSGQTSNYRGQATQGLQEMHITAFGDQLPQALEAIIDVEDTLTVGQAVEAVLQRGGLTNAEIDIEDVSVEPCMGGYVRGVSSAARQVQPLLVAHQLVTQDRNGVVCVSDMDAVDVVSIENGAQFSDLGTVIGSDGQAGREKFSSKDDDLQNMPTSVGVRHQDPDNVYVTGYQHFGLRQPEGVEHVNEQVIDLTNVVITRAQARNLAATLLRRAYVNRRRYDLTLPAAYMHVLENDLLTWTDDEGEVHVARVLQRDLGANYLVRVVAVRELTGLAVGGSAAQAPINTVPQTTGATATVFPQIIDAPAVTQDNITTPSLTIATGITDGSPTATCTIWESRDSGSYQPVGATSGSSATGLLAGTLPSRTASEVYGTTTVTEYADSLDVFWLNTGQVTIESCTKAQAEAGQNWCVIFDPSDASVEPEIAAFRTVVDNGGGLYTLSDWLRGLRGTPSLSRDDSYAIVLMTQSLQGQFRRVFSGALPQSLSYKVVPPGGDLATTAAVTLSALNFRNVLPLPVRKVTKTYSATTGTRFEVEDGSGIPTHWERAVLPLGTQPPHTLDEPFEAYKFTIYRGDAPDTVFDTYTLDSRRTGSPTLRDRYFDFGDARATSAGYTPGPTETYTVGIQQIGQHGSSREIKDDI